MPYVGATIRDTRSDEDFHGIELVEAYKSIDGGAPEFIENYEVPRSEQVVEGEDVLVYAFDYSYKLQAGDVGTLVLSYVALPPNAGIEVADSSEFVVLEAPEFSTVISSGIAVGSGVGLCF